MGDKRRGKSDHAFITKCFRIFTCGECVLHQTFLSRVSFARCLYRESDITLLDDPLSAVDAHTCEHLWTKGVKKMLKGSKRTTLIVTHQVDLIRLGR